MFERCTEELRRAIYFACYEALRRHAKAVEAEHLLLGLLRADTPTVRQLFPESTSYEDVREQLSKAMPEPVPLPDPEAYIQEHPLPLSSESKHVIRLANEASLRMGHSQVGLVHTVVGLTAYAPTFRKRLGLGLSARRHLAVFGIDARVAERQARLWEKDHPVHEQERAVLQQADAADDEL